MKKSRSEYVTQNVSMVIGTQIVKNVISFIGRSVFIQILGAEYLGVNGLFSSILMVLSFAELGVGSALVYSMYKPLAENDNEKLKALMDLYAITYRIIGTVILILGLIIMPWVPRIVGTVSYVTEDIRILYLLTLLSTVSTYFLAYKKSILIADQKSYIVNLYEEIFHIIAVTVQSIILVVTKKYILYLIIGIVCNAMQNIWIAKKVDKKYKFLTTREKFKLEKTEMTQIINNTKAMFINKVGCMLLDCADNIFISILINVVTVGLYSNYRMIINIFKTLSAQIMNPVIASVGNLNVVGDIERKKSVFNETLYLCSWYFGFTAAGLFVFINELIEIWVGDSYLFSQNIVLVLCIHYYFMHINYPADIFRNASGNFVHLKYMPALAAGINILLNIPLGTRFGIAGIIAASIIARCLTTNISDPYIVYRYVLQTPVVEYFVNQIKYILKICACTICAFIFVSGVNSKGWIILSLKAVIFTVVWNGMFFLINKANPASQKFISRLIRVKESLIKNIK